MLLGGRHFTAEQAAHHLGLGEDAVVTVPTDDERRIDLEALDETLARLESEGRHPFALVGTAGTTDFGSIDPLEEMADRAAERDLWFHVDAAYGGACAISDRLRPKLAGIDRADSIGVDFHKLFYQPIAAEPSCCATATGIASSSATRPISTPSATTRRGSRTSSRSRPERRAGSTPEAVRDVQRPGPDGRGRLRRVRL